MGIHRVISALSENRVQVQLDTVDLACLVLAVHRGETQGRTMYTEQELRDLYVQACDAVVTDITRPAQVAATKIDNLYRQRIIARIDSGGLVRQPTYALTALGQDIAHFLIDEERLTAERLSALLGTIRVALAEILADTERITTEADWHRLVVLPLETQVTALVAAIDRRSRGLGRVNDEVRAEIAAVLRGDWYQGIERCEVLLRTTREALAELQSILLTDGGQATAILDDIEARARACDMAVANQVCRDVRLHIERIEAWSLNAFEGWCAFYEQVQAYIRSFVRLDPGRHLEEGFLAAVRAWRVEPWSLLRADEPALRFLRPLISERLSSVVHLPAGSGDDPAVVAATDTDEDVERLVAAALAAGAATTATVLRAVLPQVPPDRRYALAGVIAEHLAPRVAPQGGQDPRWVDIIDGVIAEDCPLQAMEPTNGR